MVGDIDSVPKELVIRLLQHFATVLKIEQQQIKDLNISIINDNEVKLCCDCKTLLKDGFINRCPKCWDDIYFPK